MERHLDYGSILARFVSHESLEYLATGMKKKVDEEEEVDERGRS